MTAARALVRGICGHDKEGFVVITKMIYKVRIVQCALAKHLDVPLSEDAGVLTDWKGHTS